MEGINREDLSKEDQELLYTASIMFGVSEDEALKKIDLSDWVTREQLKNKSSMPVIGYDENLDATVTGSIFGFPF